VVLLGIFVGRFHLSELFLGRDRYNISLIQFVIVKSAENWFSYDFAIPRIGVNLRIQNFNSIFVFDIVAFQSDFLDHSGENESVVVSDIFICLFNGSLELVEEETAQVPFALWSEPQELVECFSSYVAGMGVVHEFEQFLEYAQAGEDVLGGQVLEDQEG